MNPRPVELGIRLRKRSKGPAVARDKDATLAAILSAAEIEFARYGLPGARVAEIAKNAGVTKGLIFHYFESKEHLFEAVLLKASAPLREAFKEIQASDVPPPVMLRMILERFLEEHMTHPLPHLLFTLESIQNQGEHYRKLKLGSLFSAVQSVLEKGVKQGCFCELDITHTAINILGLCTYYFIGTNLNPDSSLRRNPYDEDRLRRHAREVMRFVEAGTAVTEKQVSQEESTALQAG